MKNFAQKLRERRTELALTQVELAEMVGVTGRSIYGYEAGEKVPRPSTVLKLAQALDVSAEYLRDDSIDSPASTKDIYIAEAGRRYGKEGERDIRTLLDDNIALFAGGDLSQSEKDTFFEAVMRAYITCKDESKARFERKMSVEKD